MSALGDEELIALLLTGGVDAAAARVFAGRLVTSSLGALSRAKVGGLRRELGLDAASAGRLCAAFELGRRTAAELGDCRLGERMNADAVARWASPRLTGLEHEEVWVLCLDGRSCLRSVQRVGQGGVHGCALLPRDVLLPVVREAASAFVIVHNHPSGDPTPSREDQEMTRALAAAADVLSVPLLDHVVVARGGHRSMLELGFFDRLPR